MLYHKKYLVLGLLLLLAALLVSACKPPDAKDEKADPGGRQPRGGGDKPDPKPKPPTPDPKPDPDPPKPQESKPPQADIAKQFSYGGHTYYVIKKAKTWADAAAYAKKYRGYLTHITSKAEQDEIEKQLAPIADQLAATKESQAPSGNMQSYLWLGATDQKSEETWVWDGDNDGKKSQPLGKSNEPSGRNALLDEIGWRKDAYHNWGGSNRFNGKIPDSRWLKEPDNFGAGLDGTGGQDFAAMCIGKNGWNMSTVQYEWNDLGKVDAMTKSETTLYFIMEVDG